MALAYILFKLIAALIALALFPITIPLLVYASRTLDGVTLLAGYHTAYNILGVAVLLPLVDRFTRFVERILPERGSPLTRYLDPAALVTPIAAEEAVRRSVARSLEMMCRSIGEALTAGIHGRSVRTRKDGSAVAEASDALRQAREYMSEASGPPESEEEQRRLTRTLHALDHASRLAELAGRRGEFGLVPSWSEDVRAGELCADAMRYAAFVAGEVGAPPDATDQATSLEALDGGNEVATKGATAEQAMARLKHCAKTLRELQRVHRKVTLSSVAAGAVSADEAIARIDTVRRLEALARRASRSAAYLVDS